MGGKQRRVKMAPIALTLVERRMVAPFTEMEPVGSRLAGVEISSEPSIVNAFRGMVSIQVNNVLIEWDGILDYENALLVAKLFSKMAFVLAKMDEAVQLWTILALKHYPSTRGLTYTVLPSRVKNLTQYEVPIKDVCRQVPTYSVQEQKEGTALAIDPNSCFKVQILSFLRLSICGELPGF
uniref:Gastrokine 3, pseudogene n=1 Tax=Phocoena sinus TaxID=42100 RepID=A0A8C9CJ88_PHOSS